MNVEPEEVVVVSAAFLAIHYASKRRRQKVRRQRRWWMVKSLREREKSSATNLTTTLSSQPSGCFENFCRLSMTDFETILSKVAPFISKINTNMRKCIPANERLAITLRFLASGDSFISLERLLKISHQSISKIVHETCAALTKVLQDEIKFPSNEEEWKAVLQTFERWDFPHCMGALNGKQVILGSPIHSGSNYKGTFSILLLALVDGDYCIKYADIITQGRVSDAHVYNDSKIFSLLESEDLPLPPETPLPGRAKLIPSVVVANDAFALGKHLMKPIPGNHRKGARERIFNYRLSRANRTVENVFGIMAMVFRVLRKPMLLEPNKATQITMACCLLHNFLRKSSSSSGNYTPPGSLDEDDNGNFNEGSWRRENGCEGSWLDLRGIPEKSSSDALEIREEFTEYFVTSGALSWQNEM